jgi:hypothetical protein
VADLGGLSTQYQRASKAASVFDQAVGELDAKPVGLAGETSQDVGRYLLSIAGLIDPKYASQVDVDFVNTVPNAIIARLGDLSDEDPTFSDRLVATARGLIDGRKLEAPQLELVKQVADIATEGAIALSREILIN